MATDEYSLTPTSTYQLQALSEAGYMMSDIQTELQRTTRIAMQEITLMFENANLLSFNRERVTGELAGQTLHMTYAKRQIIQNSIRDFESRFLNMTGSIGMKGLPIEVAYHNTLNTAYFQVATGARDYGSAVRSAVKDLSDQGLQYISYGRRNDHLDVAVRRAVLTGLQQCTNDISELNAREMDADGYETSAHVGARPTHEVWQGRQFAIYRDRTRGYPIFDDVVGDQMDEPNCRHTKWGIFLGISTPMYTEEQRQALNKDIEFDGKTYSSYEATQVQRQIERETRSVKRDIYALEAAQRQDPSLNLQGEIQGLKGKQRDLSALYTRFSEETGLLQQRERMGLVEYGRLPSEGVLPGRRAS